jgi:hypothetical protein
MRRGPSCPATRGGPLSKRRRGSSSGLSGGHPSNRAPSVFLPTVIGVPNEDFAFTDNQIAGLEEVGQVKLSEKQKVELVTLAQFWIDDLRLRSSARPKQFRDPLEKLKNTLSEAREACRLNDVVGSVERHLLHWAMETPGAEMFPGNVMELERQIDIVLETVDVLLRRLPDDRGRKRPFDDERRIMCLADIFEKAGGHAIAYWAEAETSSMANTPFRIFAQQFYALLRADNKRDPGGLDNALRRALAARRARQGTSS